MDFDQFNAVVDELSGLIIHARVDRVYQGIQGGIHMVLHGQGSQHILLLAPDRAMPRMHLVTTKPASTDAPHGFVLLLRSRLPGMRVAGVRVLNSDRVAELRFARQDRTCALIFELFGSAANLILIDESSTILAVYHPVPISTHSERLLAPGAVYSPLVARVNRKTGMVNAKNTDQPDQGRDHSANREVELFYERLNEQKLSADLRTKLLSLLQKNLKKTDRRIASLSGDLASTGRAEEHRAAGEMILANLKHIAPGDTLVNLIGYDGRTLMVKLDPARSASDNAALYFKKYKKAKTGIMIIRKRLEDSEAEAALLQGIQSDLERAADVDALIAIRFKLEACGMIRPTGEGKKKTGIAPLAPTFRTIVYQGWKILVGKSAASNDHITMKLARPDDLWLHAEGMPGSHVLVGNPESRDIPPDVLLRAAGLAAHYSKGRGASKVPVTFTRAKFVHKPRGAKAGSVALSERKTIMVAPEGE